MEKLKQKLHQFAKSIGLRITIEGPMNRTNFLDITLDLAKKTYAPFRKQNNETKYINTKSNHPRNILRQIPDMISKRISNRSANKEEFVKVKEYYNKALKESGYKDKIKFQETEKAQKKQRNRKRKIIWYNPPFCNSVKSNIARKFINLIKKHFNKKHPLYKIFNNNSINISYSCMPSIAEIITSHNRRILESGPVNENKKPCCRKKENCPLSQVNKECDTENVVYKAYVKTDTETKTYIGLTANSFKKRWYGHQESIKKEKYKTSTALSGYIWELKENNINYELKWDIIRRVKKNRYTSKYCRLCTTEAAEIMKNNENPLNKKNEMMGSCRHRFKFALCNWKKEKKKQNN